MNTVYLWAAPTDVADERLPELEQVLSNSELERAGKFHFDHLRRRFIGGRAFLKTVLAIHLGCRPGEIEFEVLENGKPCLKALADQSTRFSFSRSDEWAIAGIVSNHEIGVDLEKPRQIVDLEMTARGIFNESDYREWAGLPAHLKKPFFYRAWTRKEARGKADGTGILTGPKNIDVPVDPIAPGTARILGNGDNCWNLSDWKPFDNSFACLAIKCDRAAGIPGFYKDRILPVNQLQDIWSGHSLIARSAAVTDEYRLTIREFSSQATRQ